MKKFVLIFFCLIFAIGICGCAKSRDLESYSIFVSESCEEWENEAAALLCDKIKEAYGVELEITRETKENYIIVGKSFLSDEMKEDVDYEAMGNSGYAVKNIENNYVITANNKDSLEAAIDYFATNIITEKQELIKESYYFYPSEEKELDLSKNINVATVLGRTHDIYMVPKDVPAGYRYGPSFIVNDDGTIDAWFASGGSGIEQWDWIVYKHYDGNEWSEEKCVLQPTPNALDHYSCCDPGVIYTNGYYYLGYTSTLNNNQADNNLFVARSKNPDGPFEKWNGNGWGGNDPQPLVYFSEDQALWGIGEASFVELNGTLYIYYTVSGSSGHCTAVATADATSENWPETMEFRGYALKNTTSDAIDVKYVDEYQRFIAVASDQRLTSDSYIVFYESRDGLSFEITDICKKDIYQYCHNPGISGNANGHITLDMTTFIGYAYGPEWGVWNTRYQEIELSLGDGADTSEIEMSTKACRTPDRDKREVATLDFVGISTQTNCVVRVPVTKNRIIVTTAACTVFHNTWTNLFSYRDEVEMYGYDENVIKRTSEELLGFDIVGIGETMVTIEFRGHITYLYVIVHPEEAVGEKAVDFKPLVKDNYDISCAPGEKYEPQIKSIVTYDNGAWEMIWDAKVLGIEYEYDASKIKIDETSHIIPIENGTHTVTVKYKGLSYQITVNVDLPELSSISYGNNEGYEDLICYSNNTEYKVTEDAKLLCKASAESDPYIIVDYTLGRISAANYRTVTVKYMIPETNSLGEYTAQIFFKCNGSDITEAASQRAELVKDGQYHELTFDLANSDYWQGTVNEIRLDYFDTCTAGDEFYIESITLNN